MNVWVGAILIGLFLMAFWVGVGCLLVQVGVI